MSQYFFLIHVQTLGLHPKSSQFLIYVESYNVFHRVLLLALQSVCSTGSGCHCHVPWTKLELRLTLKNVKVETQPSMNLKVGCLFDVCQMAGFSVLGQKLRSWFTFKLPYALSTSFYFYHNISHLVNLFDYKINVHCRPSCDISDNKYEGQVYAI